MLLSDLVGSVGVEDDVTGINSIKLCKMITQPCTLFARSKVTRDNDFGRNCINVCMFILHVSVFVFIKQIDQMTSLS